MEFEFDRMMSPVAPSASRADDLLERCRQRAEDNDVEFTAEQARVMTAIFCDQRNVLVTGGAGVGKTMTVTHQIIAEFEKQGYYYGCCATTGIAGSHIGGRTIHSFLGIGLGPRWAPGMAPQDLHPDELEFHYKTFAEALIQKRQKSPAFQGVVRRLKSITHLILDEVSMMPGNALLGFVDYWLKKIRNSKEPFGGIRMIFVGDALQLPPVCVKGTRIDWFFLSWAWQAAQVLPVELTKVFRQRDAFFMNLLNRVRTAEPFSAEDTEWLRTRVVPLNEQIQRTLLCSTNAEVDNRNRKRLDSLPGDPMVYDAKFIILPHHLGGFNDENDVKKELIGNKPIREQLTLKIGMPVLITVNSPEDAPIAYYNGSKGVVDNMGPDSISIRLDRGGQQVAIARRVFTRNSDEEPDMEIHVNGKMVPKWPNVSQFPVLPASGMSVHRSQGMSLDECMVDLTKSFAPGHVYVALSRLRTPDGLWLANDELRVKADNFAIRFTKLIREGFYK